MDFDFDIYCVSRKFMETYPNTKFPELMCKEVRPYACLLIDTHTDYLICVPYRSQINHRNAFMFTRSKRSRTKKSGLDYSKVVLIKEPNFLGDKTMVDNDEYKETIINLPKIVAEVTKYINGYIQAITEAIPIDKVQFDRKYKFTTLKYFHDILNIEKTKP